MGYWNETRMTTRLPIAGTGDRSGVTDERLRSHRFVTKTAEKIRNK